MKILAVSLLCGFPFLLAAGGVQLQDQRKNLEAEQQEASRFLDQLSNAPASSNPGRQASYGSLYGDGQAVTAWRGGAPNYREAGKSPYQTNATLDTMSALSMAGMTAMGTASQGATADRLNSYGRELSQSGDPALSQAGGHLQDQAGAMNSGDREGAENASNALRSMPRKSLPYGYRASAADMTWNGAMQSVATDFMANFASEAGSAVAGLAVDAIVSSFSKGGSAGAAGAAGAKDGGRKSSWISSFFGKLAAGSVRGTNTPKSVAKGASSGISQAGVGAGQAVTSGLQSGGSSSTSVGSTAPGVNTEVKAVGGSADGKALPQ